LGIQVEALEVRIERGAREFQASHAEAKARRDIRIASRELREAGPQPRCFNRLGNAFLTIDEPDTARQFFRHALAKSSEGSSEMLEAYHGLIDSLEKEPEADAKRLAICVEATRIYPTDVQLLTALGQTLFNQGQMDAMLRAYQAAYRYGQIRRELWHLAEARDLAAIRYSGALQVGKRDAEAREVLAQALEMNSQSLRLRRQFIEFHIRRGARDEALALVDAAPDALPHRDAFRQAVLGALHAAQRNWTAARSQLTAAHQAGCRDTLCLRWLTLALLATSSTGHAESVLGEWLRLDPTHPDALRCRQKLDTKRTAHRGASRRLRFDSGPADAIRRARWAGRITEFDRV
jgi:tetratricopeptide (TPR) repeat protein